MAKKRNGNATRTAETTAKNVSEIDGLDDEEIDEEEAFNSDDERQYGSLFASSEKSDRKTAASDSESNSSETEGEDSVGSVASDDEDGDGGRYMLDLLHNLDNDANRTVQHEKARVATSMAQISTIPESAAAAPSTRLTLDALMTGISDTKGFGSVQRTLRDIEPNNRQQMETTKVPVPRVVSERVSRKLHYEDQKADVSLWTESVKQNREADCLDFRPKANQLKVTRDELIGKFEPTTDFERELAQILQQAGSEADLIRQEEDDLGEHKLSLEECSKRRGQLAKMRALLFYEELKRHQINKIKSKKYRKIRKKQRERGKDAETAAAMEEDPVVRREMEEKEEVERIKERMTLAHRNTSKWAKRVLRRGGNVDMETRRALSSQLQKGEDLKKKSVGHQDHDDSIDDDNDDLVTQARNLLNDKDCKVDSTPKGLLNLEFMKRGLEVQRERAKEEARQLLKELQANENEDDTVSANVRTKKESTTKKKKRKDAASEAETEKVLPKGKIIASSLQFGNSSTIEATSVATDDSLDASKKKFLDIQKSNKMGDFKSDVLSEHKASISLATVDMKSAYREDNDLTGKKTKSEVLTVSPKVIDSEESNPWITTNCSNDATNGFTTQKKKKLKKSIATKDGVVDVKGAAIIISPDNSDEIQHDRSSTNIAETENNVADKMSALSQEELVRRAFASPNDKDMDEEFKREKEEMRTKDDPTTTVNNADSKFVSGWGSWVGLGVPPPRPPKKLPKHLQPPEKKVVKKRKRQDDGKPSVIISEKKSKKNAQFQINYVPYPYSSKSQYERAMAGGIGPEWNVTSGVSELTRPKVLTRAGKIIRQMDKKSKAKKRSPAKF